VIVTAGLAITLITFNIPSPELLLQPSLYNLPLNILYSGSAPANDMTTLMNQFSPNDWKTTFY
jgi:ATP-binding cassette subfamily A (ABC1) protein 3